MKKKNEQDWFTLSNVNITLFKGIKGKYLLYNLHENLNKICIKVTEVKKAATPDF